MLYYLWYSHMLWSFMPDCMLNLVLPVPILFEYILLLLYIFLHYCACCVFLLMYPWVTLYGLIVSWNCLPVPALLVYCPLSCVEWSDVNSRLRSSFALDHVCLLFLFLFWVSVGCCLSAVVSRLCQPPLCFLVAVVLVCCFACIFRVCRCLVRAAWFSWPHPPFLKCVFFRVLEKCYLRSSKMLYISQLPKFSSICA